MIKTAKKLILSVSSINEYLLCPAKYSFAHRNIPKIPHKIDYLKLCERQVLRFVKDMHGKKKAERKYFYVSIDSARRGWFGRWNDALIENKDKLMPVDTDEADKYGRIGWYCIKNYWENNINRPDPIYREKRYRVPWSLGVELLGVVSQVRSMSMESIKKFRPEIIKYGKLPEMYKPEVLVMLETGYNKFNVDNELSEPQVVKELYSLQRGFQAAAYTWLYKLYNNGKYPVGFYIYRLKEIGENKGFFIKGDNKKLQRMFKDNVDYVKENIQNELFSKSSGPHCVYCDYIDECIGDTNLGLTEFTSDKKEDKEIKQLKFKLRYSK